MTSRPRSELDFREAVRRRLAEISRSGNEPIADAYREQMRALAAVIDVMFNGEGEGPKQVGFAVLLFPFGDDPKGRVNYISNANRADMLCAMKEFIARAEGRMSGETGHG
jgi:hypothetical protein